MLNILSEEGGDGSKCGYLGSQCLFDDRYYRWKIILALSSWLSPKLWTDGIDRRKA